MSLSIEQAFQILEVPSSASWEEVRQAYREMAKVWHPDRFHDDPKFQVRATKKTQDINAAYQLLETHYQSPPPLPKQNSNDEMFERWTKDTEQQRRQSTTSTIQTFPIFNSLDELARYFSYNLPYHVYPCRIERSNNKQITPEKAARISVVVVMVVAVLTWLTDISTTLLNVVGCVALSLMAVEWLCKKLAIPDALILTELGVTMVEGIAPVSQQFTATTAHTFHYENLIEKKWNDEEISFVTLNGLRFNFTPTSKDSLTVPDTKWFKENVYSAAHVVAHFKNRQTGVNQ